MRPLILLLLIGTANAQELRGYIRLEANGKVYEQETVMVDPGPLVYPTRQVTAAPYRRSLLVQPRPYYREPVQFRGAYGGYCGYGYGYGYGYGGNYHRGYINR